MVRVKRDRLMRRNHACLLRKGTIVKLAGMVRPFDLRDLALVRRLGTQGVALHAVSALVDDLHPLRDALMSMVVGGEFPTFVWKQDNGESSGFVQLRVLTTSPQAFILYISPRIDTGRDDGYLTGDNHTDADASRWLALLDHAIVEAGQRGVHSVVAEVDELAPELPLLRRAGFAVYTRQDIWKVTRAGRRSVNGCNLVLQRRQPADDWDIQLLYANMVPRLVQLVEPMPLVTDGDTWVLRDGEELAAFVHIHHGNNAAWLRFFIHPDAEMDAADIAAAALDVAMQKETDVVYCCVRRYESWLPSALERSGFELWASQAVMVKHTVHHSPRAPETSMVVEGQRIPASSPLVRQFQPQDPGTTRRRQHRRDKVVLK